MKREKNRELIERVRLEGCIVNNQNCSGPVDFDDVACDVDHVRTQGSGGGDVEDNLMPLCRVHHGEKGQIGYSGMINKYRRYHQWVADHNRDDIIERARRTDSSIKDRPLGLFE